MAASPQVVTSNPLYLNARTNIYTAEELRKPLEDYGLGQGVMDYESFRVRQRAAGANMSVDVTGASLMQRAWIRSALQVVTGPTAPADSGMYRIDYFSASILNLDIAAADATNPRIDQVYLSIEDAQSQGANNQATVRTVTGTPTGGATLDNRTGVGAAPAAMASILLADILVPAASATVVTANIRDRRPGAHYAILNGISNATDRVQLVGPAGSPIQSFTYLAGAAVDNKQIAQLVFLPKRFNPVTVHFRYLQGAGTANAASYVQFLCDASGRVVNQTNANAFVGAANSTNEAVASWTGGVTHEAGWYYLGIGFAAMTASSSLIIQTWRDHPSRNVLLVSATGGTTPPTTILGFTDQVPNVTTAAVPTVPVSYLRA